MSRVSLFSLFALFILGACSSAPDPTQPRTMGLNDEKYSESLGDPVGYIREIEAGFSNQYSFSILFPLTALGANGKPGLEIIFDAANIQTDQDINFGAQYPDSRIYVTFYPAYGHKFSEGQLLVYSPRAPDGGGTIRFEKFDPQLGGQVTGALTYALFYGYYESAETFNIIELPEPRKLELWNFEFDVILQESPF